MGMLLKCCAVPVSKVSCDSEVVKFNRIRVVIVRVLSCRVMKIVVSTVVSKKSIF